MTREKKQNDLINNLDMAFAQLREAIQSPIAEKRDLGGNIMAFVNTYELLWNALKEALGSEGIEAKTPRQCFEEAFKAGILADIEVLLSGNPKNSGLVANPACVRP